MNRAPPQARARSLGQTAELCPLAGSLRPPREPPPRKAVHARDCERLEQLPSIGVGLAADLRRIGILQPQALGSADPLDLYQRLCQLSGKRQDPCVLDTFMAATDFMRGAAARPWWSYTAQRKRVYGAV